MRLSRLWSAPERSRKQTPRLPPGQRIYAIGDVHGCLRQLEALLGRIAADCAARPVPHVTLIYLGDYIDRGPDSAGVLQMVQNVPLWASEAVALKGNHEEMLERFLADANFGAQWRHYGGIETLASYGVDVRAMLGGKGLDEARNALLAAMPDSHQHLIANLRHWHAVGDYFFCHAGVRPGVALDQQSPADLLWIREEFLASEADHGQVVIHGHSPTEQPEIHMNRINVDTGAYATGRLTCSVLDSDSVAFISVGHSDLV